MNWEDIKTKNDLNLKREYIRNHLDGFDIIRSKIHLKRKGRVYTGLCPFHNEKTPSFTVFPKGYINPKGQQQNYTSFSCFGCGKGGDIINFLSYYEGLSIDDTIENTIKEHDLKINDTNVKQNLLKEKLNMMKNTVIEFLSFDEINMVCSSICKNHLLWVKNNYPNLIEKEFKFIDNFYKEFDEKFEDMTQIEANEYIKFIRDMIQQRKDLIFEVNNIKHS